MRLKATTLARYAASAACLAGAAYLLVKGYQVGTYKDTGPHVPGEFGDILHFPVAVAFLILPGTALLGASYLFFRGYLERKPRDGKKPR